MLDKIRENSRSVGTYLIFGAIIIVFVAYFGQGSAGFTNIGGGDPDSYAARVNGEEITVREFQMAYQSLLQQYQQQAGGQFDEAMAEQLGLKDNVIDNLVERQLLVDAARESGLAVSDADVAKAIREIPAFQQDGQFDFNTYKTVLANAVGLTPEKFEGQVRNDLLREKMIQQVRQAAKATDDEVRDAFRKENDKANLTFVRFAAPSFFQDAKPTDEEIQAYLATEEGKAAVEKEFTEKSFRFNQPKRVQAQHILLKVPEDAAEEEVEAARARLVEAKEQAEGGADFGALATELSEDPGSKEKGGDLGFFGPGTMAKPFEEAAFALGKGEISEPVRTRFGFHLIKVNDVKEAEEQTLDQVDEQIAGEFLRKEKAQQMAQARAEETLAKVKEGQALTELYPSGHSEDDGHDHGGDAMPIPEGQLAVADETGLFNVASEYMPKIGVSAELAEAVRTAEEGTVLPKVFHVSDTWVVAVVGERAKPDMDAFAAQADQLRDQVLAQKEAALVQDFTRSLREKARVEKNPAIFAAATNQG